MSKEKPNIPIPQGKYVPAVRHGDLVFTSGMTPRDGDVLVLSGKVRADEPLVTYREAVRLAAANALEAARNMLDKNEKLAKVLSMTVFIQAEESFTAHPRLADFASEYLYEELGPDGIGCRAAVGVSSLPGNAPVEIQMVVSVKSV
ncbi:MAG TPA: RidA family protein [Peptococcaceae bacterium]|nr:RidA family protein [Peptococcaceae bacterium]